MTVAYTKSELERMGAMEVRAIAANVRKARRDEKLSAVDLQRSGKEAQIVYILTGVAPVSMPEFAPAYDAPAPEAGNAPALDLSSLANQLADVVKGLIAESTPTLDVEAVQELIASAISRVQVQKLEIKAGDAPAITVNNPHRMLHKLVKRMNMRDAKGDLLHNWIAGMAGSGKTRGVIMAAAALGLDFYITSFSCDSHAGELIGMIDAHGKYHRTAFREAFEHGGVFMADEIDSAPAEVLTGMNAALDGADGYQFPDGYVKRSSNFRCVAGANTFGTGPDAVYVGRTQLDGATLNRFIRWEWEVDESLESTLSGNAEWAMHVSKVRKIVASLHLKHIVGPRQSMQGAALLANGEEWAEVEAMTIYAGLDANTVARIRERLASA